MGVIETPNEDVPEGRRLVRARRPFSSARGIVMGAGRIVDNAAIVPIVPIVPVSEPEPEPEPFLPGSPADFSPFIHIPTDGAHPLGEDSQQVEPQAIDHAEPQAVDHSGGSGTSADVADVAEQGIDVLSTSPDYPSLTNAKLADELRLRGLATSGPKADLVSRLQESDNNGVEGD